MTSELNSQSRIVVVGTSGSGKSTFARKVAAKLALKDVELDALFWGPNWTQTPQPEFRAKIEGALAGVPGWIVHGNYSKVRDLTTRAATNLIWLDYSRRIVFWRVFKRSFVRIFSREILWAGNRETIRKNFFSKDSIILWSVQTYKLRREQYEALIRDPQYAHLKVTRFKDPGVAEQFLNDL